jgi:3-hydroxyacyl-[acyl-carrier-protein] dehydratase
MISDQPKRTLPHREPFLWVHRLIERDSLGQVGVVELDVPEDLDVFRGHFPEQPVFPGVLQMESAAQACLWIHLGELPVGAKLPEVLFVGVDNYRFRKPVIPPETLAIQGRWLKTKAGLQIWEVETKNKNREIVSQGTFWLKMGAR